MAFKNTARHIALLIFLLLLTNNCCFSAILTYDGCKSDTANSYVVGGWCFYMYYNSSWPANTPSQDVTQTFCQPHGNLAVGVTYKMMYTFTNKLSTSIHYAWFALSRNMSSSFAQTGWYWNSLLPNGGYTTAPAIMPNIPWGNSIGGCVYGTNCIEPNNVSPPESGAMIVVDYGMADFQTTVPSYDYGVQSVAVICQFVPPTWSYTQRGNGRFASSGFLIEQASCVKFQCTSKCHSSVLCISFAFNPTSQDCQIYSASPEDPRFVGNVTADSTYLWFIRDGMEY